MALLNELRLLGFAAAKEIANQHAAVAGTMDCPLCGRVLTFNVSQYNGHFAANCESDNCVNAME